MEYYNIKNKRIISLVFISLFSFLCSNVDLYAKEAKKIGVVNIEMIVNKSDAARKSHSYLKKIRDGQQIQLENILNNMKKKQIKYKKLSKSLSREAKNAQRKSLERELGEVQQDFQEKGKNLDNKTLFILNKISKEIEAIIYSIAQKQDYDLVLQANNVLYSKAHYNLTTLVIEKLNKKLPKIDYSKIDAEIKKMEKQMLQQ